MVYKSGATKFVKNRLDEMASGLKWKEIINNQKLLDNIINRFCKKYNLKKNKKFDLEGRGQFGYHPIYEETPTSFVKFTITMCR